MTTDKRDTSMGWRKRALRLSLLGLVVAALAGFATACGGGGDSGGSDGGEATAADGGEAANVSLEGDPKACSALNLYTWEGEAPDSLLKPFEAKFGVKVNPSYMASSAEAIAKLAAGATKQYDMVIAAAEILLPMRQAEVIKPLDPSLIDEYDKLFKFATEPMEEEGQLWGLASDWGVNPFLYSTDVMKSEPTSWADLWSPELKGQVSLWEDISLIWVGASALGMDDNPEQLFELSQEQLDEIRDKMLELKGNVRAMWSSGGDLIQLFANKEVGAAMGWTYVLNELKAKGAPVEEAKLDDMGAQAWTEGPALSKDISPDCEAAAYEFMNWLVSPKGQLALSESSGYTPVNPATKPLMSKELQENTGMNDPEGFLGSAIVKKAPADPEAYNQTMQEIIAGLS